MIRGTTFPAGHVIEPGHVGWDTKGDTHIGPFEPSPAPMAAVEALADACTRAGMPTHALADARGAQWRKLIFNAASNAIAALTGRTHGQVAEPPTRELAWAVMAEGRAVADAQGIMLDMSPEELFDHAARKDVAYGHKPSMLQDVEAGRETEIDFLNGAIVAFGERHGVDAPLNRALTQLIKGKEHAMTSQAEIDRRYANVRAQAQEDGLDAVVVAGSEYSGFEGAVRYLSGFRHPPPLRLRRPPGRGRAVDRLPEGGALGRRPRRDAGSRTRSSPSTRGSGSPTAASRRSASTGSTT